MNYIHLENYLFNNIMFSFLLHRKFNIDKCYPPYYCDSWNFEFLQCNDFILFINNDLEK